MALGCKGDFTVKVLRELIDEKVLGKSSGCLETRWIKWVPRKVCIFIWRMRQGRIPVHSVLDHYDMDLNSILCPCCGDAVETVDHCLVRCKWALDGWKHTFNWWNMGDFNVSSVEAFLHHKGLRSFSKKQRLLWQSVIWSMLYTIWDVRNKVVFKIQTGRLQNIGAETQVNSFAWISNRWREWRWSWDEWRRNLPKVIND